MYQTNDLNLCYVEPPWAYFTSAPLDEQWGDDWDDAPWQHNAGPPYDHNGQTIKKVAYQGILYPPGEGPRIEYDGIESTGRNGNFVSVEDMNRGDRSVPWLVEVQLQGREIGVGVEIHAGVSLTEFIELVETAGGQVYLPR